MEGYVPKPGEAVLYRRRGSEHFEVGVVKSVAEDGAFVWYSSGDTASKTPFDCIVELKNEGCIESLAEKKAAMDAIGRLGLDEGMYGMAKEHTAEARRIMEFLAFADYSFFGDGFDFRVGGDGDNGEFLMDMLDLYFESRVAR